MALLEDIVNGGNVVTGLAVGVGALVVLPLVRPVLRLAAKVVIQGGLIAYDQATRLVAGAMEEVGDVVGKSSRKSGRRQRRGGPFNGTDARAT